MSGRPDITSAARFLLSGWRQALTLLGEPRGQEPGQSIEHRHGGVPPADDMLCRGGWEPDQLVALVAMALEAADAPGEAKSDIAIMAGLFRRMRDLYRKEGGAFADPILNLNWNYINPIEPGPDELAQEINGRALVEVKDAGTGAPLLDRKSVV